MTFQQRIATVIAGVVTYGPIVAQYAWRLLVNVLAGLWQICQGVHARLFARWRRKVWGWYAIIAFVLWLVATGGASAFITNVEVVATVVAVRVAEALTRLGAIVLMLVVLWMLSQAFMGGFASASPKKRRRK